MILRFPSEEVLQIAITSEIVPAEIASAAAAIARDADGAIWLETEQSLRRECLTNLKQLGVQRKRSTKLPLQQHSCWYQAIAPRPVEPALDDRTEVLLELNDSASMAEIVTEMLRLGNDRQSVAQVSEEGETRFLLRVIGPPLYTMLRSTEAGSGPRAYASPRSRIWVEYGFEHLMAERFNAPVGHWLLIDCDGAWRILAEPSMVDLYRVAEFALPNSSVEMVQRGEVERRRVPVQLADATATDPPELWVLQHDSMAQMEALIRRSDDELIARLAFAVVIDDRRDGTDPTVVLRVRPSKQSPPVLVLDALACLPSLRIPNLFLPAGRRLQPPLRRDAVIDLLASQTDRIHWLRPDENDSFVPHSVPDAAFRPLSDWVDYVIDHHAEPLRAWIASHQFDFEPFVCSDEQPKKKPPEKGQRSPRVEAAESVGQRTAQPVPRPKRERAKKSDTPQMTAKPAVIPKQDELQQQLRRLETDYRESTEPLDSPSRSQLWLEMGCVQAQLKHPHDTTICFANALWNHPGDLGRAQRWLASELRCAGLEKLDAESFANRLSDQRPAYAQPGLIAAQLVAAESDGDSKGLVAANHLELTQYLQHHEKQLPIRAAWLAWMALHRILGLDVLMLARARDRLLERLFRSGMAPEFDMAAFMRSGATSQSDRFAVLRQQITDLHTLVQNWVVEPEISKDPQTKSYVDLVFAYALARLGETAHCNQLVSQAEAALRREDSVHRWLLGAYQERIQQALSGGGLEGSLSHERMSALEQFEAGQKYVLDRLLQRSRILEPHLDVDPYENFLHRYSDDLSRELSTMQRIADPEELAGRLDALLADHDEPRDLVRILPDALSLAPRLGESYAGNLLPRVWTALETCEDAFEKAALLHRAILIAAHYGRVELVQSLVAVMNDALPDLVDEYLSLSSSDHRQAEAIETLISQSFRGMRRLGMRDEIGRLYGHIAELLVGIENETDDAKRESMRGHRLGLCVAGGWYFFGQLESARVMTNQTRERLQSETVLSHQTTRLLCAYLDAVSGAPVGEAIERVGDVFSTNDQGEFRVTNLARSMTTDTHFSLSHLDVAESAVMSLIHDDFTLSAETRRWLDEDEYLVRKQIHHDMQAAVERSMG